MISTEVHEWMLYPLPRGKSERRCAISRQSSNDLLLHRFMLYLYEAFYIRIIPFLVDIVVGYILLKTRTTKMVLSEARAICYRLNGPYAFRKRYTLNQASLVFGTEAPVIPTKSLLNLPNNHGTLLALALPLA